jgi:hypothetical protein
MLAEPGIHDYSLNRKYSKLSDKELKILQKNFKSTILSVKTARILEVTFPKVTFRARRRPKITYLADYPTL